MVHAEVELNRCKSVVHPFGWFLVATACDAPTLRTEAALDVVIRVSADGAIESGTLEIGGAPAAIAAEAGDRLIHWAIPQDDLIDSAGRPLELVTLSQARVGWTDEFTASAGCGRCLGLGASRPARIYSGDLCPVPEFIVGDVMEVASDELVTLQDPALVAAVRSRLRIAWPGSCACELGPARSAPARLTICPVAPEVPSFPFRDLALGPDGSFAGFAPGFAKVVPATGDSAWYLGGRIGTPAASTAFGDGQFLVVHKVDTVVGAAQFEATFVSVSSGQLELRPVELDLGLFKPRALEPNGLGWSLFGSVQTFGGREIPGIAACQLRDDTLRCVEQSVISCHPGIQSEIGSGLHFEDGGAMAVGDDGQTYFRESSDGAWICDPTLLELPTPDGSAQLEQLRDLTRLGPTLVACGIAVVGGERRSVALTASVAAIRTSADSRVLERPEWVVTSFGPSASSCQVWADPALGRFFVVTSVDSPTRTPPRYFELDEDGVFVAQHESLGDVEGRPYSELARPIVRAVTSNGHIVLEGVDGAVVRGQGEATERIHGAETPLDHLAGLARRPDEDFVAFRARSAPLRVTLNGCDAPSSPFGDVPSGEVKLAIGGYSRALLVISRDGHLVTETWDLASGQPIAAHTPVERTPIAGAQLGEGWVLLDESGSLSWLDEFATPPIHPVHPIAVGPELFPGSAAQRELKLTSLAAAEGVVWTGGEGVVGRILVPRDGEIPVVELGWTSDTPGVAGFSAAHAPCPDFALLSRAGLQRPEAVEVSAQGLGLRLTPSDLVANAAAARTEAPVAITGPRGAPTVFFSAGSIGRPPTSMVRPLGPATLSAVGGQGGALVSKQFGHLVAVVDSP
ncbi:MAG: hypothetical protein HY791_23325 [Deltaproteobacteria bacterium]|nr:hypothetical protein [Deltaproteobacteria bacterium]